MTVVAAFAPGGLAGICYLRCTSFAHALLLQSFVCLLVLDLAAALLFRRSHGAFLLASRGRCRFTVKSFHLKGFQMGGRSYRECPFSEAA
jgi:hypothetical protein